LLLTKAVIEKYLPLKGEKSKRSGPPSFKGPK
jgi:hypothetical protein